MAEIQEENKSKKRNMWKQIRTDRSGKNHDGCCSPRMTLYITNEISHGYFSDGYLKHIIHYTKFSNAACSLLYGSYTRTTADDGNGNQTLCDIWYAISYGLSSVKKMLFCYTPSMFLVRSFGNFSNLYKLCALATTTAWAGWLAEYDTCNLDIVINSVWLCKCKCNHTHSIFANPQHDIWQTKR